LSEQGERAFKIIDKGAGEGKAKMATPSQAKALFVEGGVRNYLRTGLLFGVENQGVAIEYPRKKPPPQFFP